MDAPADEDDPPADEPWAEALDGPPAEDGNALLANALELPAADDPEVTPLEDIPAVEEELAAAELEDGPAEDAEEAIPPVEEDEEVELSPPGPGEVQLPTARARPSANT